MEIATSTSISAPPKQGKTHLAMTWPGPIKLYSFDQGAKFVKQKSFKDKEIVIEEFILPIIDTDSPKPYAEPIWEKFQKMFQEDCYSGKFKTLVVDTNTALWSICRQAIVEAKNRKKLLEVEYALPNLKMSSVFAHPKQAEINLVVINYLKDRYVKGENTGEKELNGWGNTEGMVDIVLEMERVTKGGKTTMNTLIKDNRFERDMNGKVFADTCYNDIMALLIGD
jgi:hypothetical protein